MAGSSLAAPQNSPSEARKVALWSGALACLAAVNACIFSVVLVRCVLRGTGYTVEQRVVQLSAIPYVWQTTWRCVFISEYVDRHTMSNHALNSVLVARLFAFLGELTFGVQLALALRAYTSNAALSIIPLDFLGQLCATFATAARDNLCFLYEGILWTMIFSITLALAVAGLVQGSLGAEGRAFLQLVIAAVVPAILYMSGGYLPLCFRAWRKDVGAGGKAKPERSLRELAWEALVMRVPTKSWAVWQREVVWQTLYFSLGTWSSLWLMAYPPR